MHQTTIGILGATGSIGSQIVKILSTYDLRIRAFTRNPQINFNNKNVEIFLFDFNQPNPDAFKNIQKLFWVTPNQIENFYEDEYLKILNNSRIEHIVQLSSMHPEIFDLSRFEQLLGQSNIPCTILRANTFMQNFNKSEAKSIKDERAFYYPAGDGKTSFIDIRDIAKVAANLLINDQYAKNIFTLTGPEALDYYQIARILSEAYQTPIRYIDTWAFPEYEADDNKNNLMRQSFFESVRNNLFSAVTQDLEDLLKGKSISFREYANDYWRRK